MYEELHVSWDSVSFTSNWNCEIIYDEVICASTNKEKSIIYQLIRFVLPYCHLQFGFILFQVFQLLPQRNHILKLIKNENPIISAPLLSLCVLSIVCVCERERDAYCRCKRVESGSSRGKTDSSHELLNTESWIQIGRHELLDAQILSCITHS